MSSLASLTWIPFNGLLNAAFPAEEEVEVYSRLWESLGEGGEFGSKHAAYLEKIDEVFGPKLAQSFVGKGLAKPGTIARLRFADGSECHYAFGGPIGDGTHVHDQNVPENHVVVVSYAVLF